MRVILQRVTHARVEVEGSVTGEIGNGLLVLAGFTQTDTEGDLEWMAKKILQLRIFNDTEGKMNLSVADVGGDLLVVSQFTLFADYKKGNRPSYLRSAAPEISVPLYERFLAALRLQFTGKVETGRFGASMQVSLLNDGPVTIFMDSKNPEF